MKKIKVISCFLLFIFAFIMMFRGNEVLAANADNLLVNGNAEEGMTGWIDEGEGKWCAAPNYVWQGTYVYPQEGGYFFLPGAAVEHASLYQEVDISEYPTGETFVLSGWLANWDQTPHDQSILQMDFLNKSGTSLATYMRQQRNPKWAYHSMTADKPQDAVRIRVTLIANRYVGSDNDAYFDDIKLCAASGNISKVYISGSTSIAKPGDIIQLTADNGSSKSASDFEWSSSYDEIATVDRNGLVTFHENGFSDQKVSIYAKDKMTGVVGAYHFNMDIKNESEYVDTISESDDNNILINGNAEQGTTGWTGTGADEIKAVPYYEWRGIYVYPQEGGHFFIPSEQKEKVSIYQEVDISEYPAGETFILSGWLANWDQAPHDQSTLQLEFLDSKSKLLQTYMCQQRNPGWTYHSLMACKPQKAAKIRVTLIATRFVGSDNDGYFDDIRLTVPENKVNKVYVISNKVTAKAGEKIQLTVNNGVTTKASKFTWSSSYDAAATVDQNGLVTIVDHNSPVMIYAKDKSTGIIGSININSDLENETPAPDKVSGFKVTKNSSKSVTLSWTKNANANGYYIYQYNTKTKKYEVVKTIKKGTTNTITISKLSKGKTYKFQISAYSIYGKKTYKSKVSQTISVKVK